MALVFMLSTLEALETSNCYLQISGITSNKIIYFNELEKDVERMLS